MRTALIISAASLCALASAASAQTIPANTGTPAYSYETQVPPQPGFNGSCDIISGNRVCSGQTAGFAPNSGFAPGLGPVGAIVGAPLQVAAAPFGAFGAGTPVAGGGGMTNPAATGTPIYSYESRVPPQPGAVGYCDLISGNHVCMP